MDSVQAFNPILVWFYHWRQQRWSKRNNRFQSHFGLILSQNRRIFADSWRNLSIPFWSDFIRYMGEISLMNSKTFQSHFGLILSSLMWTLRRLRRKSFNPILVWFYPFSSLTALSGEVSFQSHFGLILSIELFLHTVRYDPFNPILVWFYHYINYFLNNFHFYLSIPFWSDFIRVGEKRK